MRQKLILFLFLGFIALGCRDKSPEAVNEFLVSAEEVDSFSAEDFKKFLNSSLGSAAGQVSPFVQTGIKLYKIVYRTTDIDGTPIQASGALVIPQGISTALSVASLQHGTLFNESDAPSYYKANTEATIGSFFASLGIIVAMPDYIGYGESRDREHPYEHNEGLAIPTVDMLKAVKEFTRNKKIGWNKKVMLAGYSEGGYATMATFKYLEENLKSEFPVSVCIPGSGAYNKSASFDLLINNESSGDIGHNRSYIWVLLTYIRANNLNLPVSYFFKEPYASEIEAKGYLAEINVSLNRTLTPEFIEAYNSNSINSIKEAILKNDVHNWKPSSELRMYHGNADEYVPYLNSTTALEAMQAQGAEDVKLVTINNGTHGSTLGPYIMGVLELFVVNK